MTDAPTDIPTDPAAALAAALAGAVAAGGTLVTADQLPATDPATGLPLVWAYVNWGRWVADCAVCPSAMQVRPDNGVTWPTSYDGQPPRPFSTGDRFRCGDALCRAEAVIVWPDRLDVVDQLLDLRGDPSKRNWHPWETPADLIAENIEHGVTPVKGL